MKKLLSLSILMLAVLIMPMLASCGSDDDDVNNSAIAEYIGKWSCTYPETYMSSTIVEEGTILVITSSGDMTWTMSNGSKYNATMRALGDGWADITYNGKTYRAEIYVKGNFLTINVNNGETVKDFPFDGSYRNVGD